MKSIVVYYSWSGNTEIAAKTIAAATRSRILELREKAARKLPWVYVVGGFQAILGIRSRLAKETFDLKGADTVILCSPIWASSPVPAVNTFLAKADLKGRKVAVFFTLGDDKPPLKAFKKAAALIAAKGGKFGGSGHFQVPLKGKAAPGMMKTAVKAFIKKIRK